MNELKLKIPSLDKETGNAVRGYIDTLTKPPGSLGRLEELVNGRNR